MRIIKGNREGSTSKGYLLQDKDYLFLGEKVVLREKRWEDVAEDYAWKSDAVLARLDATMPLNLPFSLFSLAFIEELRSHESRSRSFAIDTLAGKHIGNCMYYNLDKYRRETEVGIIIGDSDYWGKGYGSEAVMLLVKYIFQKFKFNKVYLHTLDWNDRALRCFGKCGFLRNGTVVRGEHSFVTMELYRNRWEEGIASQER